MQVNDDNPFFTIFIPTFNRAYILEQALESCLASSFTSFEIVVVDDGSRDDTKALVQRWAKQSDVAVQYHYQENSGKHVAHNTAVQHARGQLLLTLDSDDKLVPSALQLLHDAWLDIPLSRRGKFCGVMGLSLEGGKAVPSYPQDIIDTSLLELRSRFDMRGERRGATRLDILKQFPFPVFDGERYCRPGMIEMRMAHHYLTRFANIVMIDVGHMEDGICANRRKILVQAPKSYRQYFLEEITQHADYSTKKSLKNFYKRYIRHSFNSGVGAMQQYREVPNKWYWLQGLPESWFSSLADKRFKRRISK